ncbi:MAG: CbiX/SirB N-terminal domain-containing protein [Betaproteobacteria bacterium]
MAAALILFAHGSKDPEWVRPFEALRETVQRQVPASVVALAYLESATPNLSACVRSLGDRGIITVRVLPLFLAMGKHLRHDIPALAATVAREFAGLQIEFLPALGEAPEFVDALGRIAQRAAQST